MIGFSWDNRKNDVNKKRHGASFDDAFQCVYRSEFQENLVQMIRLARLRFNPIVFLATSHTFDDPCDMATVNIFYRSLKIVASDMNCELIPVHHYWAGYLEEYALKARILSYQIPDIQMRGDIELLQKQ